MPNKGLFVLTATVAASLIACGGGGGGGNSMTTTTASPVATSLKGTASVGAPLSNATVTLTDANGKTLAAVSGANGAYIFSDIGTLVAPILIQATGISGGSSVTYSSILLNAASNTANVANVSPITDAIVLQATGVSGAELSSDPNKIKSLDVNKVKLVSQVISKALASVLEGIQSGSSSGYDPIATEFIANGVTPQDKVLDLVSISANAQISGNVVTINIVLTDKTGANGSVTITPNATTSSVTVLPAANAAVVSLPIGKITDLFSSISTLAQTSNGLSSQAFSDLLSDNFLRYGKNKTQMLASINSQNSGYVGWTLSNPVVNMCLPSGACLVGDTDTWQGTTSANSIWIIWNPTKGIWQWYGNQQQDLNVGFSTSLQKTDSTNQIIAGIDFSIRDSRKTYPYNSASAIFQDKNGVQDLVINFANKTACPTSSSTYWGLPIDNPSNPSNSTFCGNWTQYSDESVLNTINAKIAQGNYQLIVKAYTTSNRTGTPVQSIQTLTKPLLTKSQVVPADFPAVTMSHDSSGPYLSIQYANNFNLIGSVCLSSASTPNYCDMTNTPAHTSVYSYTGKPLSTTYRPITTDGWQSSETVKSYFVHAQDRFGRDLRVNN